MQRLLSLCLLALIAAPALAQEDGAQEKKETQYGKLQATISTDKGDIRLELLPNVAPRTVMNFVNLAQRGYYDGLSFHRVINDFMIQGGDPLGNGQGGPGYEFENETDPDWPHDKPGILSMANRGPGTNGSQFFITHKATPWLNGKHTVFGHVVEGQDVVNKIEKYDVIKKISIEGDAKQLFEDHAEKLAEWNKILDEKFPKLTDEQRAEKTAAALENAKKLRDEEKQRQEEMAKRREQQAKQVEELKNKAQEDLSAHAEKLAAELGKEAQKTDSGLVYFVIEEGAGDSPKPTDTVKVHYTGWLLDGTKFDSSVDRGQPIEFPLSNVIKGWTEGVSLMKVGGKSKLLIPPDLGYGARGAGGVIPPFAVLEFDVELIEIK